MLTKTGREINRVIVAAAISRPAIFSPLQRLAKEKPIWMRSSPRTCVSRELRLGYLICAIAKDAGRSRGQEGLQGCEREHWMAWNRCQAQLWVPATGFGNRAKAPAPLAPSTRKGFYNLYHTEAASRHPAGPRTGVHNMGGPHLRGLCQGCEPYYSMGAGWLGPIQWVVSGFSTGSISRLTTTGSWSERTSTQESGSSSLALIS